MDDRVLQRFLTADGRLKTIPTKHSKLLLMLDHLARGFEPGRAYPQPEVHGVKAFCASKSAAGSSSSRRAPTGSGGEARVGVSTASYAASVVRQSAACRRIAPIASPKSGPDTALPLSESHRVSGRSSAS